MDFWIVLSDQKHHFELWKQVTGLTFNAFNTYSMFMPVFDELDLFLTK